MRAFKRIYPVTLGGGLDNPKRAWEWCCPNCGWRPRLSYGADGAEEFVILQRLIAFDEAACLECGMDCTGSGAPVTPTKMERL